MGGSRACRGCGWRWAIWRGFCRPCGEARGLFTDVFDMERQRHLQQQAIRAQALAERDRRVADYEARMAARVPRTVIDDGKELVVTWDGAIT